MNEASTVVLTSCLLRFWVGNEDQVGNERKRLKESMQWLQDYMSEPEKARANGLVSEERKRHKVIPPQLTEVTVLVDDKWVLCFHVITRSQP